MAADTCCYASSGPGALVGIMDRLWFCRIILLPDQPGLSPGDNGSDYPDENEGHTVITTCDEFDEADGQSCLSMEEDYKNEEEDKSRQTIGAVRDDDIGDDRVRASSFSPPTERDNGSQPRRWFSYSDCKSLRKSASCRSFEDLEMEEVKGFMDLGFVFEKEHLNPRMMSVIPGLQRLGLAASDDVGDDDELRDEEIDDVATGGGRIRPYLSEAWLVTGPNSPLMKLRLPDKVYASADMKKHLKRWARTVASVIKLES
ncbi:hypothetical protein MLD38_017651 [Melastoma candidum]|uniref:Uncharacterized protein n=1 Tax=Melastoma candidum TaxID=119954 RepID=A0ACB9QUE1_9MYRT|nr:hypothetical protein MLD38_017651 [Melastoma candidum]